MTPARRRNYTGVYQLTTMFDERFTEFYNAVVNLINGGTRSLSSMEHKDAAPVTAK